jgi:hypothetical protein
MTHTTRVPAPSHAHRPRGRERSSERRHHHDKADCWYWSRDRKPSSFRHHGSKVHPDTEDGRKHKLCDARDVYEGGQSVDDQNHQYGRDPSGEKLACCLSPSLVLGSVLAPCCEASLQMKLQGSSPQPDPSSQVADAARGPRLPFGVAPLVPEDSRGNKTNAAPALFHGTPGRASYRTAFLFSNPIAKRCSRSSFGV